MAKAAMVMYVRVKVMVLVEGEGPATVSTMLQQGGSNCYFTTSTTSTSWELPDKVEEVMAAVVQV